MNSRLKAALKLSSLTPEGKVTKGQGIKDSMTGNPNFPPANWPITPASVQTIIDDLHNSIIAANAGTVFSTSAMHEKERILVSVFNIIKAHVEFVANSTADPATVIVSAGMQVAENGGANLVTELTLEAGGEGKVTIKVPRGRDEKAFIFEMSSNGTDFVKFSSTTV